jgi:alpha-tubulin suppressor-like RCC1 family protein
VWYHSLATKTDGTLWAWGRNSNGQLGQNNTTQCSSPVQIPGTTWSSISGSGEHSLATKTDGTLWSWGLNDNGN